MEAVAVAQNDEGMPNIAFYIPPEDAQPVMVFVEGYRVRHQQEEALIVAPAGVIIAWVPLGDIVVVPARVRIHVRWEEGEGC